MEKIKDTLETGLEVGEIAVTDLEDAKKKLIGKDLYEVLNRGREVTTNIETVADIKKSENIPGMLCVEIEEEDRQRGSWELKIGRHGELVSPLSETKFFYTFIDAVAYACKAAAYNESVVVQEYTGWEEFYSNLKKQALKDRPGEGGKSE